MLGKINGNIQNGQFLKNGTYNYAALTQRYVIDKSTILENCLETF